MMSKLFDLESGLPIDNVLFEILLESSADKPLRNQYVTALRILEEGKTYPIFRCLDRTLTEEEYLIGEERLFSRLKDILNGTFQ